MTDRDNLRIIVIKPGGNPRDPAHFMVEDIIDAFCELGHQVEMIDLQIPVLLNVKLKT